MYVNPEQKTNPTIIKNDRIYHITKITDLYLSNIL